MRPRFSPNILRLGFVSLLTDISSEMIYPVLPLFMGGLGLSKEFIGLVEGVAESTASFMKLASGWLSDRFRRRKPAVIAGYGLSAAAKPLLALTASGSGVLGIRFLDRLGKGIRTSPRDALLAETTPREIRGAAFGFHRAMDSAGAVIGPLLAFLLLSAGAGYTKLFLWAFVPALLGVLLLFGLREAAPAPGPQPQPAVLLAGAPVDGSFRLYLAACALFTLGNSSDAFLILRSRQLGVDTRLIPLLWMALNVMTTLVATPAGRLSDRVGRKKLLLVGLGLYSLVYCGFAFAASPWHAWVLFGCYGVYYGLVEGNFRAFVADLVPRGGLGSAYGLYHAVVGIVLLPASLLMGFLWEHAEHTVAFLTGGMLAGLAACLLLAVKSPDMAGNTAA